MRRDYTTHNLIMKLCHTPPKWNRRLLFMSWNLLHILNVQYAFSDCLVRTLKQTMKMLRYALLYRSCTTTVMNYRFEFRMFK